MNAPPDVYSYECPGCCEFFEAIERWNYCEDQHGRRWHRSCWGVHSAVVANAEAIVSARLRAKRVRRRARILRKLIRAFLWIF
jgi:hypothetical protein